jgi:hypothetical protein
MRNKLKLSSDGGDFGSKKCKLGYGGACGGFWRETAMESGGRFCVDAIDRIPASVAVNVFLHVIYSVFLKSSSLGRWRSTRAFCILILYGNRSLLFHDTFPLEAAHYPRTSELRYTKYSDIFVYLQFILRRFFNNSDCIASNERLIGEYWIGKDMEGSCRGLILRCYPGITCMDRGKPRKNSIRIAGLRAEIWTRI